MQNDKSNRKQEWLIAKNILKKIFDQDSTGGPRNVKLK